MTEQFTLEPHLPPDFATHRRHLEAHRKFRAKPGIHEREAAYMRERRKLPEIQERESLYRRTETARRHMNQADRKYASTPEGKEKIKAKMRKRVWIVKVASLKAYGGDPPRCACCGESNIKFLTLDHINNDGTKQRKMFLNGNTGNFNYWLRKQGYPKNLGIRVLCANCNMGRQWNGGICPHKENPIANG
jgi:hypothetical protein